jgi:glycosyltransferase involved in cell wall biosynthesis
LITIAVLYAHPLGLGGVEAQILSLMRCADRSRYRWVVLGACSAPFEEEARSYGAECRFWKPAHALDFPAFFRLKGLLSSLGPDLVHMHSLRAALFGVLAARFQRRPTAITVHIPALVEHGRGFRRSAYHLVERLLWARADQMIFVSARLRALSGAPSEKSVVIENGVPLSPSDVGDDRSSIRRSLGVPEGGCVVLCVARLEPQKGIDLLLEAARLFTAGLNRLWLVGEGSERSRLESRAKDLGLEDHALFLGARRDVPRLLRAADVFVLPSRYEGSSMALLEAMAAGLPCVATDVGDAALVLNGAGRVVPPGDSAALGQAMGDLIANPGLRVHLGEAARRAAEAFSDVRMTSRTLEAYDQALSSGRR